MSGRIGLALGAAAGVAAVVGLVYFALAPVEEAQADRNGDEQVETENARPAKRDGLVNARPSSKSAKPPKAAKPKRPPKFRMQAAEDWFDKLPPGDRAIAKRIQDAQDADDQQAVFKAAEEAIDSDNVEVRSAAVESLSLQGEAAMPLLLKFVGDGNHDVAEAAYRAWDDAVDTVDGDANKLVAVKQLLEVAKDQEHVKSAVGKIEMFDQSKAIRELAKLARGEGDAAEAAKESYENVTGEPFTSWAAAELKAITIDRDNLED